ncbi:hypothetical protein Taro_006041, partial [Colocasia esculenta]|nr:hypothetical protein [Colocasia esculenta]
KSSSACAQEPSIPPSTGFLVDAERHPVMEISSPMVGLTSSRRRSPEGVTRRRIKGDTIPAPGIVSVLADAIKRTASVRSDAIQHLTDQLLMVGYGSVLVFSALDINSGLASRGNPSLLLSPPSPLLFPHLYPCASSLLPVVDRSTWEGRDVRNSGRSVRGIVAMRFTLEPSCDPLGSLIDYPEGIIDNVLAFGYPRFFVSQARVFVVLGVCPGTVWYRRGVVLVGLHSCLTCSRGAAVGPFIRDCEIERLFLCCVVRVEYWPSMFDSFEVCPGVVTAVTMVVACGVPEWWHSFGYGWVGYGYVLVFSALDINSGLASRGNPSLLHSPPSPLLSPTCTLVPLHYIRRLTGARGKAVMCATAADQAGNDGLEGGIRGKLLGFQRDLRFTMPGDWVFELAECGDPAPILECLSSQCGIVEACVVFLDTLTPVFELYVRLRERRQ